MPRSSVVPISLVGGTHGFETATSKMQTENEVNFGTFIASKNRRTSFPGTYSTHDGKLIAINSYTQKRFPSSTFNLILRDCSISTNALRHFFPSHLSRKKNGTRLSAFFFRRLLLIVSHIKMLRHVLVQKPPDDSPSEKKKGGNRQTINERGERQK